MGKQEKVKIDENVRIDENVKIDESVNFQKPTTPPTAVRLHVFLVLVNSIEQELKIQ